MTRQAEDRPATVPLAQQAGAIPAEWRWVKPCAWTIPHESLMSRLEEKIADGSLLKLIRSFLEAHILGGGHPCSS
jgi:hypothetical protein